MEIGCYRRNINTNCRTIFLENSKTSFASETPVNWNCCAIDVLWRKITLCVFLFCITDKHCKGEKSSIQIMFMKSSVYLLLEFESRTLASFTVTLQIVPLILRSYPHTHSDFHINFHFHSLFLFHFHFHYGILTCSWEARGSHFSSRFFDFIREFSNDSDKGGILFCKLVVFRLRCGHFLKKSRGKISFSLKKGGKCDILWIEVVKLKITASFHWISSNDRLKEMSEWHNQLIDNESGCLLSIIL